MRAEKDKWMQRRTGETVRRLRLEAGLSQTELARRTGMSQQAVSDWEVGKTVPRWRYVRAAARALGVSVDYILTGGRFG